MKYDAERKLKVGDKITVKHGYQNINCYNTIDFYISSGLDGLTGEVVVLQDSISCSNQIGIKFDKKNLVFHDLQKRCEYGFGYWLSESHVDKQNDYSVDLL